MEVKLSEHFNYRNIFKITFNPILMFLFTSLYSVVDGFFISNFISDSAFAGVNLIWPVLMIIGGTGFMFGTGGSALTSMLLGQKKQEDANKSFSTMVYFTILAGLIISFVGFLLIRPITEAMASISSSSTEDMVNEAINYGRILAIGQAAFMLQNLFQSYFLVDEKPKLGFKFTVYSGVTNMVLDALFIAIFKWGTTGAALATCMGYIVGGIFPLIYFINEKNGNIKLIKTLINWKYVIRACTNGASEFVNNTASSIVGIVFNMQLLKYYGQNGVSAYGVIMYVSFIFVSIFVGYSVGMAPVISYNYGAKNNNELQNVLNKSLKILFIANILLCIAGVLSSPLLAWIYCRTDAELVKLATYALRVYSLHFIMCGFSIFLSSFFTALNNGLVSAIISFLRTLVFQIVFVIVLPLLIGAQGIWWAILLSEVASVSLSFIFLLANRKKYGY